MKSLTYSMQSFYWPSWDTLCTAEQLRNCNYSCLVFQESPFITLKLVLSSLQCISLSEHSVPKQRVPPREISKSLKFFNMYARTVPDRQTSWLCSQNRLGIRSAAMCKKCVQKYAIFFGTLAQHAEHSHSHTLIKCLLATRIYQISQAIKNS